MNAVSIYAPQRALRDYTGTQLSLIKRTVAKDTNADEFDLFVEVCKRVGLDPFRRQVYCMVYNKDKPDKRQCVFITGIDGFRAVAQRNGDYRPDEDEPVFVFDDTARDAETNPTGLIKATVYAYKRDPLGIWHRIAGVAYWQEFAPIEDEWGWDEAAHKRKPTGKKKLGGKWLTMPQLMLAKCAESQALRKGWPEDLSGIYAPEEMAKPQLAELSASEVVEIEAQETRLALVNAGNKVAIQWSPASPIEFVPNGALFDRSCKWLREQTDPTIIEQWREINRNGLAEFWALHKADALELKREIEARIAALKKPEPITIDQPAPEPEPEPVPVATPAPAAPELTLTPPPEDREAVLRADAQRIATAIGAAPHVDALDELMDVTMDRRQALPAKTQQYLDGIYAARRNALAAK